MDYMSQKMDEAIEAGLHHQEELIKDVVTAVTKRATEAATKWMEETFDESMLELMEDAGIIANGEGFFHSALAQLQVDIEIATIGEPLEDDEEEM